MDEIRQLADPDRRTAARDALVAMGPVAVGPLLHELLDERSPVSWWDLEAVLHRIGPAGFDEARGALAGASGTEARRRAGRVFSGYGPVDRYLAAVSDPAPVVRLWAVRGVARSLDPEGSAAGPSAEAGSPLVRRAVDALLPLLGDADAEVAEGAQFALTRLGRDAVPALRRARLEGPGRVRARALTALAEAGGEEALSPADRAVVDRLIRIKLSSDVPEPLAGCWPCWIAVPGGDQQGISALLGLTSPRPATFALGADVVDCDTHDRTDEGPRALGRVYLTPEVDGWTLVLGAWCDPCDEERADEVLDLCLRLSERYGHAQAYYYGAQGDGSAWLVAEGGTAVRRYSATGEAGDALLALGEPLPQEEALRAELGLPPDGAESEDEADEWLSAAFGLTPAVAAALSVNPLSLGPHTQVRGTGLIALTPYGVEYGVPAGAYRI
ncbi:hypothetical protein AB0M28_12360 [Streptomyces sp. NPDC051940]|uniref:hypothetical protein n=1 Tax=Streptomyces sp. NPDC051940 TaxID=3155675 RepID=UPI003436874B